MGILAIPTEDISGCRHITPEEAELTGRYLLADINPQSAEVETLVNNCRHKALHCKTCYQIYSQGTELLALERKQTKEKG